MKRQANPPISAAGERALAHYEQTLREQEDLTPASRRTYLSDVRHFIAWYQTRESEQTTDAPDGRSFDPQAITTPTLTRYRLYLQIVQRQKPASVNRALISLKRYCGWAIHHHLITYDPSVPVKLVGQEGVAPRRLDEQEEQALVAAGTLAGILRDRVLIVLLLHTGLRAREVCQLRRVQVKLGKRSGFLEIIGKRHTYREVPLNAPAQPARATCWKSIFPRFLLIPSSFSPQARRRGRYQNGLWAILSKNMQAEPTWLM